MTSISAIQQPVGEPRSIGLCKGPSYVSPTGCSPIEILLVEDNAGDVRLTQEALDEGRICVNLDVVRDGVEALAFLRHQGPYAQAVHPDLVLLDLNMPKKGGLEVLAEMKADPDLRRIPVVILTTSRSDEDALKSYDLHANCYITKPADMGQFIMVVKSVEDFWFTIVRLPPDGDH